MLLSEKQPESDFIRKLKWIMFFRLLFSTLLLGSTILFQFRKSLSFLAEPLLFVYALTGVIFILSFVYSILLHRVRRELLFAYVQFGIDTLVVTLIIYVTGGFSSIFSFLYLVVIIYSSMLLFRRGSMIIASLCSIQYGILVDLEYYDILTPYVVEDVVAGLNYTWSYAVYKILITMMACFAVAFLSSLLSEQERRTKKDLYAMEAHVKRMERMAAVGEMAAGLAHEIKNPLASLYGSIQVLREDLPYTPDRDKLMQIVLREASRLGSLVNDFLLFAKPPKGKIQPIELKRAVSDTLALFEKDRSGNRRIRVTQNAAANIWVEMDASHLRQILWNLLLNAAESINGQGEIEVRMSSERNRIAAIHIADTGCGIPQDVLRSIFDPFFTTKPNGTGLGLSIVHRILDAYNGWIEVDSEVGRGTSITLRLKQIDPPTSS